MPALHRTILVVDVADFTDPARTNVDQLAIRHGMYAALQRALTACGADIGVCAFEDRGDGILVLVPSEFPKSHLVTFLPGALVGEVRRHNENSGVSANFRMRMALHAGEVHFDARGVVGDAINLTFRLVDAPTLKEAQRSADRPLALVVSQWFYDEVVRHAPDAGPSSFVRTPIAVKKTRTVGWMRMVDPGVPKSVIRPVRIPGRPVVGTGREPPVSHPRQLPRNKTEFTGRTAELRRLDRLADDSIAAREQAVVGVLDGMAGAGKTALVLHWAHENVDRFPDGQLHVDLHGHAATGAMEPGVALGSLLRALGLPDQQIPFDSDERAAAYRSLVAGRRMLILLDNAATAAQVRPLLPAAAGPLVLVTSRSRLSGLVAEDAVERFAVPVLSKPEAVALLDRLAGPSRGADDRRNLETLADLCGRLPLAIRIAGERVADRSGASLGELVHELADERARLNVLTSAEDPTVGVRTAFSWSYQSLPPDAARVFRLLGVHACPDLPLCGIAALTGLDTVAARRAMRLLSGLNLVYETPAGRYRLHDLVRVYAADLATDEERDAALDHLLRWYTGTALIADGSISPRGIGGLSLPDDAIPDGPAFASHTDAMDWFDAERVNLVALVRLAMDTSRDDCAWRLSEAMSGYLLLRQPWRDWVGVHEIGRLVAHRSGDLVREAWSRTRLGLALKDMRRSEEALEHAERALAVFCAEGAERGEAAARAVLALVHRDLRAHAAAVDHAVRAIALFQRQDVPWGEAMGLTVLGVALRDAGRRTEALAYTDRSVRLFRAIGDPWGEGLALGNVARIFRDLGRHEDAIGVAERALAQHAAIGDRWAVAMDHYILGTIRLELGRPDAALAGLSAALQIFCDIRDRYGKGVALAGMGRALRDMGRYDEARAHLKASIALLEKVASPKAAQVRRLLAEPGR